MLHSETSVKDHFKDVNVIIPQALFITTDEFDEFIETNALKPLARMDLPDEAMAKRFLEADFPEAMEDQLRAYLSNIRHPLAVRSSSILEDARFRAHAGLYRTYMLPTSA